MPTHGRTTPALLHTVTRLLPPLIYSGWRADGAVRTNFLVCYLLLPAPYRPFLPTTNMGASFHHQPPCFIPFLFVFIF